MPRSIILALAMLAPTAAYAQSSDVVVMRRMVANPNVASAPSHNRGAWRVGTPVVTPGCAAALPSLAPVTCVDAGGGTLADSQCRAEDRPSGAGTGPDYSTCSYRWITGVFSAPSPTCAANAYKTRTVACQRQDAALTPVEPSFCDPKSPDAATTQGPVAYYEGCTYSGTYDLGGACVPTSQGASTGKRTLSLTKCIRSDQTDVTAANATMTTPFCAPTQQQGCTPPVQPTVVNGDFSGSNGWTMSFQAQYGTGYGLTGRGLVCSITPSNLYCNAEQYVTVVPGVRYTLSLDIVLLGGTDRSNGVYAAVQENGRNLSAVSLSTSTPARSFSFTPTTSSVRILLTAGGTGLNGYFPVYGFDNVRMTAE